MKISNLYLLLFALGLSNCVTPEQSQQETGKDSTYKREISVAIPDDVTDSIQAPDDSVLIPEVLEKNHIKFTYPDFDILFYDYGFQETRIEYLSEDHDGPQFSYINNNGEPTFKIKSDTLNLYEEVFNELRGKLIQIIPENKKEEFKISYSLKELILEQYDKKKFFLQNFKSEADQTKAKNDWNKNRVSWDGWTNHKYITDSLGFYFRIPEIDMQAYENERKQKFHLKDTLIDLSGESDNIATLIYKNKPCTYMLYGAVMRIERYLDNKLQGTKHISIVFTYGC